MFWIDDFFDFAVRVAKDSNVEPHVEPHVDANVELKHTQQRKPRKSREPPNEAAKKKTEADEVTAVAEVAEVHVSKAEEEEYSIRLRNYPERYAKTADTVRTAKALPKTAKRMPARLVFALHDDVHKVMPGRRRQWQFGPRTK
jgi:hypothetical protein